MIFAVDVTGWTSPENETMTVGRCGSITSIWPFLSSSSKTFWWMILFAQPLSWRAFTSVLASANVYFNLWRGWQNGLAFFTQLCLIVASLFTIRIGWLTETDRIIRQSLSYDKSRLLAKIWISLLFFAFLDFSNFKSTFTFVRIWQTNPSSNHWTSTRCRGNQKKKINNFLML